ncbi:MAG: hypothetical protein WAR39_00835 [Prevotella sp.]
MQVFFLNAPDVDELLLAVSLSDWKAFQKESRQTFQIVLSWSDGWCSLRSLRRKLPGKQFRDGVSMILALLH